MYERGCLLLYNDIIQRKQNVFWEWGIKYQLIDIIEKGMSKSEVNSAAQANGGYKNMICWDGDKRGCLL